MGSVRAVGRVAVVGVGTMGSQVLLELARQGVPAVGLERFTPGHEGGAAGGETRMFRMAYKEGDEYVPLLREARRLWLRIEAECGERLLEPVGALTIGSPDDTELRMVRSVADRASLPVEELNARQYPQHCLDSGEVILLDREGGLLHPRRAIRATVRLAVGLGATVHNGAVVSRLATGDEQVEIGYRQDGVEVVEKFAHAIVCVGPWAADLLQPIRSFQVRRVVLSWHRPSCGGFAAPSFPPAIRRSGPDRSFSAFPDIGGGVKLNLHVPKQVLSGPDALAADVEPAYRDRITWTAGDCLRGIVPVPHAVRTYMDAYTQDGHGIVGLMPDSPHITVMAGFSGHGFKLAPVLARAAVDIALTGRSGLPVDHLHPGRPITA